MCINFNQCSILCSLCKYLLSIVHENSGRGLLFERGPAAQQQELKGVWVMVASRDDAFVSFEHVQKSYDGETLVVKDLNLQLAKPIDINTNTTGIEKMIELIIAFEPCLASLQVKTR